MNANIKIRQTIIVAVGLTLIWGALFVTTMTNGEIQLTTAQIVRVLFISQEDVGNVEQMPSMVRRFFVAEGADESTNVKDLVAHVVIHQSRLPRLLLATLAGAAFAIAGVMLQDAMRNGLAEPGIMGISMGGVVVVAFVTVYDIFVPYGMLPLIALAGGLLTGVVLLVAATLKTPPVRLVLIGVAMSALLNALTIILISMSETRDTQILYRFLVGSLSNRTWDSVDVVWPWMLVGIPLAFLTVRPLNLLQLGDDVAEGLGLPVVTTRAIIFAISIALVSAIVSVTGPISFIALLAPHVARYLLQTSDARLVAPIAALIGMVLLTGADLIARLILSPVELPVGIFTTILGAPILFVLIRRSLVRQEAR
ncbi:MAG: iron ABC transporter permease [Chloroflexota bacterium]